MKTNIFERENLMSTIIGIVCCGQKNQTQFVPHSYIHAIEDSGAVPILLPCIKNEQFFESYKKLCHGFLFCGGDDITPFLFGEELQTSKGKTDLTTDLFHLTFMKYALSTKLPILAICRGMQVLNIALGGTLFQDLSLRFVPSLNHIQLSESREDFSHKITVSSNSILYNILGKSAFVNSFHHQAVHILGTHLKATAIASDGVIEAIESTVHPFVMGIQWHPECLYQVSTPMKNLFLFFIEAAKHSKNLQYISINSEES